jgi:O-antigen ligase
MINVRMFMMIVSIYSLLILLLPFIFSKSIYGFEVSKVIFFNRGTEIIFIICLILLIVKKKKLKKINRKVDWLILGFYLCLLISTLVNKNFEENFWGSNFRRMGFFTWIHFLILYWVGVEFLRKKDNLKVIIALLFGTLIEAIFVIYQGFGLWILKEPILTYAGRVVGSFGQPNFVAGYLLICLPWLFYLLKKYKKKWLWIIISLILIAIVFTQARWSIMLAILFLGFYLTKKHWKEIKIKKVFLIGILFLLLSFVGLKKFSGRSILSDRLSIWQRSIEEIIKKPVFGYGPDDFGNAFGSVVINREGSFHTMKVDRSHNVFLDITMMGGIIALLIFLAMIFQLFKICKKSKNRMLNYAFLSLVLFLAYGMINTYSIAHWMLFWLNVMIIVKNS